MTAGDIALTTPKAIPGLPLAELNIVVMPSPFLTVTFFEGDEKGPSHVVRIANATLGGVTGFDYGVVTPGAFTDNIPRTNLTNYLTTILGVLFIGNATSLNQRKTAVVQRLVADGVISGIMTVG